MNNEVQSTRDFPPVLEIAILVVRADLGIFWHHSLAFAMTLGGQRSLMHLFTMWTLDNVNLATLQ